jgi:hypothetical protein
MPNWAEQRTIFSKRYESLSDYRQNQLQSDIDKLNDAAKQYISNGGISQDPTTDGAYNTLLSLTDKINKKKAEFANLNKDLTNTIREFSQTYDTGNLLAENGQIQQEIIGLQKRLEDSKVDAESANLRDSLLRNRERDVSTRQLYLLDRPVKKSAIPVFWVLSILFTAVGLYIFKQLIPIPTTAPGTGTSIFDGVLSFFKDARVWMSLTGASIIVIIVLAIKVAGVF